MSVLRYATIGRPANRSHLIPEAGPGHFEAIITAMDTLGQRLNRSGNVHVVVIQLSRWFSGVKKNERISKTFPIK